MTISWETYSLFHWTKTWNTLIRSWIHLRKSRHFQSKNKVKRFFWIEPDETFSPLFSFTALRRHGSQMKVWQRKTRPVRHTKKKVKHKTQNAYNPSQNIVLLSVCPQLQDNGYVSQLEGGFCENGTVSSLCRYEGKHADISIDINYTKFTTEGIILVQ